MSGRFVFIKEWELSVYTRILHYFQYIFTHLKIPYQTLATIDDCKTLPSKTLVFLPFDALCQRCEKAIPVFTNVEYIYLITEPDHNVEAAMPFVKSYMHVIYAILNLNMNQTELIQRLFPNKPYFTCFQGYIPTEDITTAIDKTIDVLAPGFVDSSDDRKQMVKALRDEKLNVVDASLFGAELDKAFAQTKIAINIPFDSRYSIWYGQRTLWPLNKQTCVVTVPSQDKVAEEFYDGLLVNVPREAFVKKVASMIRSGEWKTFGRNAYERFKTDFNCLDVFDERFYHFCVWWSSNH